MNRRLIILKTTLWGLLGGLTALSVVRFWHGLGAATNLSDAAPWGLWIALDVMAGVALAAGGFVMAGVVYIFGRERYRPLVRPAILTAFLGYVAVVLGLIYDLGLPWHIWHPLIYWQHHSVLFEVGMCVMTYLTVLGLEFSPIVLEHPAFAHPAFRRILGFLKKATIPLVIAGIILSTLHQSSLGSLFLIMPHRLHPLWYSPIIYVLFFVSAVGLGMMMVALESLLSCYFWGRRIHREILEHLGLATAVVLTLYTVLRVGDLVVRGVLPRYLDGSWTSVMFVVELLVCAVIPASLLWSRRIRSTVAGLAVCSTMTVVGMVWNRMNMAIGAIARPAGMGYFPSWMEFLVSFGIIAAAALAFLFLSERLRVYDEKARAVAKRTNYSPGSAVSFMPQKLAAPRRYSLAFIAVAALVVYLLPQRAVTGVRPVQTTVKGARTTIGVVNESSHRLDLLTPGEDVREGAKPKRLLMIDGNRNNDVVLFDHTAHFARVGLADSCGTCHHLNVPLEVNTPCSVCHKDMYEPTDVFLHESHVAKLGGNDGCVQCHADSSGVKTRETATACSACHATQVAASDLLEVPPDRWRDASGYMGAMHGLCIACHEKRLEEAPDRHPASLARCDTCHDADRALRVAKLLPTPEQTAPANPDEPVVK